MNNQTKFGILIVIIIALLALLVWGEQRVKTAKDEAIDYEKALGDEKLATSSINTSLRDKEDEIYKLKQQNKSLRDSIEILKSEVFRLNKTLQAQGQQILANRKKMEQLQMREDSLVKEIARLMGVKSNNTAAINKLEKERLELNKGMAEVSRENVFLEDSLPHKIKQLSEINEELASKNEELAFIDNIVSNTIVKFGKILPYKANGKAAKNPKDWTYTDINLELYHSELNMLENETFMVIIWDMDKGVPVSPREANAGRDSQGVTFSFTKNPVKTLRYPHYQKKDSESYAIQVYYVKNGTPHPLNKGVAKSITF